MALDDRLSDLLVDWEQSQRDGREPTLEELCKDSPDLLPVVRESIDSLKATRWMFEPDSAATSTDDRSTDGSRAALHDTELPASHLTVEQFAASIFQSGLLSPVEIHDLNQRLTASDLPGEAREIASRLVTEGKLTRYQASVLLKASNDPLLIDNYVILDTLDTGGMGLVFKALHRSMNRVVALKLLPAAMMSARDTVKRFQREVQAAAALSHSNIVAAYDAHQSAEIAYLVLEYVEGVNLFRLVKERGPLPVAVAANYVRQAATGLAYLHSRGIIHRDVKPANLILAEDGTVKLLDMGLVRFASAEDLSCVEMDQELTQAGIVIGTVAYMSPEQALDTRSADQRSDIYSLGCTLFFLLTGRSLYHEETGMKTLLAHREQPVPTIREFCEEAPVSLDAVFRTMVAKRPADRLQTMSEIVAALDACVPGLAANAAPAAPAGRGGLAKNGATFRSAPPWRRRPLRIALAVAVLAGVAVGGIYLAGILIRIKSDRGETDIYVDDPHATVEVTPNVGKPGGSASRTKSHPPNVSKAGSFYSTEKGLSFQKGQVLDGQTPMLTGPENVKTATPGVNHPRSSELADQDVERQVAIWAVKLAGEVTLEDGSFKNVNDLPASSFHVFAIDFDNDQVIDDALLGELIKFRPPSLRGLDLTGTRITDKGLDGLGSIPRLLALGLSGTQITDEGAKTLTSLPPLQELDLSKTRITDRAMKFLAALSHLSGLSLDETQITDDGLKNLPQLRDLSLKRTRITDAGLKSLENQTWLKTLNLSGTKVTNSAVAQLKTLLPNCEIESDFGSKSPQTSATEQTKSQLSPSISGSANPPNQTAAAPPHPRAAGPDVTTNVDRLVAEWVLSGRGNFVFLRECGQVEDLAKLPTGEIHLMGINNRRGLPLKFSASDVERLASLSELISLRLQSPSVTDEIVLRFKTLKKLKALSLIHARISDACLPALTDMSRLSFLDLSDTPITDAGLEQIAKIKSLNDLSLPAKNNPRNIESDPGLYLGGIKEVPLPALILDNTRTTEGGVLKLQSELSSCNICASHVYPGRGIVGVTLPPKPGSSDVEWAKWLLKDPTNLTRTIYTDLDPDTPVTKPQDLPPIAFHIRDLRLGRTPVNRFLLRRLSDLQHLEVLFLHHVTPPQALQELAAIKSLKTLVLGDIEAGDDSLQALSELTGITTLVFDGSKLTDAGLKSLAPLKNLTRLTLGGQAKGLHGSGFEALSGLTNLRTLAVPGCGLDDEHMRAIGNLTELEKLDLHDTWISGKGLAELAGLKHLRYLNLSHCRRLQTDDLLRLGELTALEHLDLSNCRITEASFNSLLLTLRKLKNLKTLNLTGAGITPQMLPELKGVLPHLEIKMLQGLEIKDQ
ncbi:MAG TPA: protein kinase [Planctomycetaceae bacterium]|jgi:serine/threonine protein kinase/Leucine-rich repeat (LRR) protein|nr:protein kinase [Planctomycetaceae bacterium]